MGSVFSRRAKQTLPSKFYEYEGPVFTASLGLEYYAIKQSPQRNRSSMLFVAKERKDADETFAIQSIDMNRLCVNQSAVCNVIAELQVLKEYLHPNVSCLRQVFHDSRGLYLLHDFPRGGDLRYHLDRKHRFTECDVSIYLVELALAMDYLHSIGLVHRDIRPETIFLTITGHVMLSGRAGIITKRKVRSFASMTDLKIWHYIAPEVFCDDGRSTLRKVSLAADWWSLGVTAYELVHAKKPFEFPRKMEAARLFYKQALLKPSQRKFSTEFVSVLQQLLEKNPNQRLSSCIQICETLGISLVDLRTSQLTPTFKPPVVFEDPSSDHVIDFTAKRGSAASESSSLQKSDGVQMIYDAIVDFQGARRPGPKCLRLAAGPGRKIQFSDPVDPRRENTYKLLMKNLQKLAKTKHREHNSTCIENHRRAKKHSEERSELKAELGEDSSGESIPIKITHL